MLKNRLNLKVQAVHAIIPYRDSNMDSGRRSMIWEIAADILFISFQIGNDEESNHASFGKESGAVAVSAVRIGMVKFTSEPLR